MTTYQYSSEWINKLEDEMHWRFYWHQMRLLNERIDPEEHIAEIGVGSGFLNNYLTSRGFDLVSIDIDRDKKPDIVGNIVEFGPEEMDFDTLLGFNVFEHIPYMEFLQVVENCYRGEVHKLFLSFPSNRKIIAEWMIRLGGRFEVHKLVRAKRKAITTKHHRWEMDFNQYTPEKIKNDMYSRGYTCRDFFRFRRQTYFYFRREERPQ